MAQRLQAKFECPVLIDLTGKQPILGGAELYKAIQFQFWNNHDLVIFVAAEVDQATVVLRNFGNQKFMTIEVADLLADFVTHAAQRCVINGIDTFFIGSREIHLDTTMSNLENDSKA